MPLPLGIMLLTRDMARCTILGIIDSSPLSLGNRPIGLGSIFHLIDMFLLFIQSMGFTLIQLTAGSPLINSLFLVRLTLINHGRLRLRKGHPAQTKYESTSRYQNLLHWRLHRIKGEVSLPLPTCDKPSG